MFGKLLLRQCSAGTRVRLEIVCKNHRINESTLIRAVLEIISDEELLKAVETASRVLPDHDSRWITRQ